MKKAHRELIRAARAMGIRHCRIKGGGLHPRLVGFVNGQEVVQAFSTSAPNPDRHRKLIVKQLREQIE